MLSLYHLLVDRLKAVVLANVGLDLEADCLSQDAARKAALLRLANSYDEEGLNEVAEEIRASMQTLQSDQPLSRSLPIATHLRETKDDTCKPADTVNGTGKTNYALPLASQSANLAEQTSASENIENSSAEDSNQKQSHRSRKKQAKK